MLDLQTNTFAFIDYPGLLELVWRYYCLHVAHAKVKDYVLSLVHTALLKLNWTHFCPMDEDVDQMVKIIDLFLPLCHDFIGRVFVEVSWRRILNDANARGALLTPKLLRLMVKLGAEPQMRQVR